MDKNTNLVSTLGTVTEESKDLCALVTMIEILRVDHPDMIDALYSDLTCHLARVHHDWKGNAHERFNSVHGVIRECRNSLMESAFAASDIENVKRRIKYGIREG